MGTSNMKNDYISKEKIHTVLKDIDRITESESTDDTKFYYRGLSNVDYKLIPSVGRNETLLKNEERIKNVAINGRPDIFDPKMNEIERLALFQHYGIPTRLMDITSNILVALYFACRKGRSGSDGVVYIFKSKKYNEESLDEMVGFLSSDIKNDLNTIIIDAPKLLLRQRVQQGSYILFKDPTIPVDTNDKMYIDKVVINDSKKQSLKKQLENLGITEASLFPENIDIFCKNIKESFE